MSNQPYKRRSFLKATGLVAGTTLVAGCSSESGSPTESETQPTSETDTATATPTETATATDEPTTTESGTPAGDVDREINVDAYSFSFEPGSEEPIVVQQGETIKLCATARDDGIGAGHGLGIPEFGVNLAPLYPDETKCTTFKANKAGTFQMLCTVQCSQPGAGTGHSNMVGDFIVEEA